MLQAINWKVVLKVVAVLIAIVLLMLAGACVHEKLTDNKPYTPPVPVQMAVEDVKNPAAVAGAVGLMPKAAQEVVREIQTVEKPVIVYKDVPVAQVPQKVTEGLTADKADKAITTQPDTKTVNVYSIHTEKQVRWGVYARSDTQFDNKALGIAQKNRDNVYILDKNYDSKRIEFGIVHLF